MQAGKRNILKQILHIGSESIVDASQSVLLLETGKNHLYFGIMSQANREFEQAGFYKSEESDEEDLLPMVLEKNHVLYGSFYQTLVSYYFPQSLLVPDKYYKYEDAPLLLNNMYGMLADSVVISESIIEWQLYNIYHVPHAIHEAMTQHYSSGKYWHVYSIVLKNLILQSGESPQLFIDFKSHAFTGLLIKHNIFQFAQIFCYQTPEDVLYYLLKICNQFSVSTQEVRIVIGGLIDKQSGIYIELQKYFLNLTFIFAPDNIRLNDSFKEHPQQFFSTIYNLATCVS